MFVRSRVEVRVEYKIIQGVHKKKVHENELKKRPRSDLLFWCSDILRHVPTTPNHKIRGTFSSGLRPIFATCDTKPNLSVGLLYEK